MVYSHQLDALVKENERLRAVVSDAIEAIQRGSTSAPVLEVLKAAIAVGQSVEPGNGT